MNKDTHDWQQFAGSPAKNILEIITLDGDNAGYHHLLSARIAINRFGN